ncbi:MAG: tryptophan-rich sensory protein [Halomonadaceae bacterium]|nr:MAG: tryptophan-rich sensory protein [Halomonadaceae bacterium]
MSRSLQLLGLTAWIVLLAVVAALGAIASVNAGDFYQQLTQPDWAPPGAVFGPVWTLLYLMMALSAWLVWRQRAWQGARGALTLFVLQLVPNVLWSWLFFAWHQGGLAFANILLLLGLIVATVVAFWQQRPLAALLLVPYLLWVSFAAFLNLAIWQLNPGLL